MGFESAVLNRVEDVLGETRKACFYNGSLFIECEEKRARSVFNMLIDEFAERIRISGPVHGEYIVDFVE
ncbi:MAG: hypothetical protein EBU90_30220 [Proteobacteria bacterium]|nr:hypothetical protein [Pseudomonadota bacterium]